MIHRVLSCLLVFLLTVSVIGCVGCAPDSPARESQEYPDCGLIIGIEEEGDLVTYQTQNGNIFCFTGIEDFFVGDLVATIMNDSGTPEVADDIVVSVRYVGWIDEAYLDNWVKVGATE